MMDFTEAFERWLDLVKAEELWKEGNKNPLEALLDMPLVMESLRGEEVEQ